MSVDSVTGILQSYLPTVLSLNLSAALMEGIISLFCPGHRLQARCGSALQVGQALWRMRRLARSLSPVRRERSALGGGRCERQVELA